MNLTVWNQYVNEAYMQANYLERDVYFIPDKIFGIPLHVLLKLIKPIHGLKDSGALRLVALEYMGALVCLRFGINLAILYITYCCFRAVSTIYVPIIYLSLTSRCYYLPRQYQMSLFFLACCIFLLPFPKYL